LVGNVAQKARLFTLFYVIARMTFAFAYLLIVAGVLLISTGLIAGALHRDALHSMAALKADGPCRRRPAAEHLANRPTPCRRVLGCSAYLEGIGDDRHPRPFEAAARNAVSFNQLIAQYSKDLRSQTPTRLQPDIGEFQHFAL